MIVKSRVEARAFKKSLERLQERANDIFELSDNELNTEVDFYNRIREMIDDLDEVI